MLSEQTRSKADDLTWAKRTEELRELVEESQRVRDRQIEAELKLASILRKSGFQRYADIAASVAMIATIFLMSAQAYAVFVLHSLRTIRIMKAASGVAILENAAAHWPMLSVYAPLAAMFVIAVAVTALLLVNSKPKP